MKITIDAPDAVYRRLKANAALQGKTVKEIAVGLFEQWVKATGEGADVALVLTPPLRGSADERRRAVEAWLREWDAIGREVAKRPADPRRAADIIKADRR